MHSINCHRDKVGRRSKMGSVKHYGQQDTVLRGKTGSNYKEKGG